jgi:hypothetical protein
VQLRISARYLHDFLNVSLQTIRDNECCCAQIDDFNLTAFDRSKKRAAADVNEAVSVIHSNAGRLHVGDATGF